MVSTNITKACFCRNIKSIYKKAIDFYNVKESKNSNI